jgi:para-nitrobenzyl esterase
VREPRPNRSAWHKPKQFAGFQRAEILKVRRQQDEKDHSSNFNDPESFMRIRRYFTLTSTVAAFLVAASAAIAEDERPQVTVDTGTLAGTLEAGSRIFRGIPYAAAPIDELRWKEPQPVSAWNGVRDASRFGDRCQQTRFPAYIPIGNRGMSENCLYLNVWSAPGAVQRPVIVWIHGGGFGYGFSNQAAYDGSAFVQKGLVYVNLNYRVGAFGFLAHPDLTRESPNKSSGNYGILDQVAALQWIKRNIAAFGGDPDNVTIFGESAGSISVNVLTASPLARGLFNRAIGDSGAGLGTTLDTLPVRPLAWAEQHGVRFASVLRAQTAEELRGVPAAEIADVGEHGPGFLFNAGRYAPNIDGHLLPEAPADVYARGAQNNVQLIVGWNLREANIFMLGSGAAAVSLYGTAPARVRPSSNKPINLSARTRRTFSVCIRTPMTMRLSALRKTSPVT